MFSAAQKEKKIIKKKKNSRKESVDHNEDKHNAGNEWNLQTGGARMMRCEVHGCEKEWKHKRMGKVVPVWHNKGRPYSMRLSISSRQMSRREERERPCRGNNLGGGGRWADADLGLSMPEQMLTQIGVLHWPSLPGSLMYSKFCALIACLFSIKSIFSRTETRAQLELMLSALIRWWQTADVWISWIFWCLPTDVFKFPMIF